MQMFGNIAHAKEQLLVSNATLVLRDNKTIPKPSKKNGHDNNCYAGIAYSDLGDQLMVWDRQVNIRIYDISTGKLILKNVGTYAQADYMNWLPKGKNISKKNSSWSYKSYSELILTAYEPPKEFSQLRSFLNKCRHIPPYASEQVKKAYNNALKDIHPSIPTVDALAYDDRKRLTPVIDDYNWPPRNRSSNTREPAYLYRLEGESLDMKTLAYLYQPDGGDSPLASHKVAFYRNLKLWKMYSISDLLTKARENYLTSFSISPQGNLACIVMDRFPSSPRMIGTLDWFKCFFQSRRVHIVIVVLDIQNDRIILKEKRSGLIGIEDKIIWRAAFFESRREFVLLNAITGEIKMYRY